MTDQHRNTSKSTEDDDTADRELVASALAGDLSAFDRLVERYRGQIYSFGLQVTRSEMGAAEIAQRSFLFAYQHLKEFGNEPDFGTWVLRIAAELSWCEFQAKRVNEPGGLPAYSATDWSQVAEEGAMNPELRRVIQDAADRLPRGHREVFLFRDMAGLSYEQIADICGDAVSAIKHRVHQARLRLHEAIDRFYGSTPKRKMAWAGE